MSVFRSCGAAQFLSRNPRRIRELMLSCLLGFVPVLLIQSQFSENRSNTIIIYHFGKFQLLEIVCH